MQQSATPIHFNIERFVIREIASTRKSIHIAMAWLTAATIQQALIEKKKQHPKSPPLLPGMLKEQW